MSGYKLAFVNFQPAEVERLHFAERYLRATAEEPVLQRETVRQESAVQLQNRIAEVERRHQAYQQALQNLGTRVRGWEGRLDERLFEQEEHLSRQLQSAAGHLTHQVNAILADQDQRFEDLWTEGQMQMANLAGWAAEVQGAFDDQAVGLGQLSDQMCALDAEVHAVREDLSALAGYQASREQTLAQVSAEWIQAAYQIAAFVEAHYAYDFFAPGALGQCWQEADLANVNREQGAFEAGLALGQQACLHVSGLRVQLEAQETEWRIWHLAALEGIHHLQHCLAANVEVEALDMDGHPLPFQVEVNVWSEGKLERLQQRVDALAAEVEAADVAMDTSQLQHMVQEELPELHARLERLVLDSRLAVLSSQARINIADLVVDALAEQGYALEQAGYVEGDMRAGYRAQVKSLDGSEVLVEVAPAGKMPSSNELSLQSLDVQPRSTHELRQRASEVARSLSRRGLQVGTFQEQQPVQNSHRLRLPQQRQPSLATSHGHLPSPSTG